MEQTDLLAFPVKSACAMLKIMFLSCNLMIIGLLSVLGEWSPISFEPVLSLGGSQGIHFARLTD